MSDIKRPINSAFVFSEGTSERMKDKKISKELYVEIKRQSELLRKCINKQQNMINIKSITYQEAIEALKIINLKNIHPFYNWEEMLMIRDIAIAAIEKRIHKKPVKRYTEDLSCTNKFDSCPFCGSFEIKDCEHCPDCGQALDWSEENA